MNRAILNDLTYAVLLSLDGGKSSGSGFLLNFADQDYLITAKHVLFDEQDNLRCESLIFSCQNPREQNENARMFEITTIPEIILKSKIDDVAAILIESIRDDKIEDYIAVIQQGNSKPISISNLQVRLLEEIQVANEAFLVGFPTSLIFQGSKHFDPGKPLLRKGIISGINSQDNTFVVDCSAYYGNSGAPILEVCEDAELKVVGIISRYIPFVIEWKNNREPSISHPEFLNSGYSVCVPMNSILELFN